MGLLDRFKKALGKTRDRVVGGLRSVLPFGRKIDEDLLTSLEETMLKDDMGPATTRRLIDDVRAAWKADKIGEAQEIVPFLKEKIVGYWPPDVRELRFAESGPTVILVAGINGSGKTTSVAKLARWLTQRNKKVILAACDTFRAAAVEQLTIWSQRCGVDLIKHGQGADPGAVAYDASEAALARGADVLLVDTAGRLHTQDHLMRELNKIERVVSKKIPGAPHEVLLVLDATIGQNAVNQARIFSEHVKITGIILAKLDGSARGGVVVGIRDHVQVPVKFVGLGESLEDLEPFDPQLFVEALFSE
jgi:fused signal recognition particle receptor